MTKKDANTEMRRCIGSKTFGIKPHEAPTEDFPKQPSQKDGLGRMCKPHWRAYTNALRKAALARKAAEAETDAAPAALEAPAPRRIKAATKSARRRTPMAHVPADDVAEHAHSESASAIRANRAERKALVEEAIREVLAE